MMDSLFLFIVVTKLFSVADGTSFADDRDSDLTWVGHLILDTLGDIE